MSKYVLSLLFLLITAAAFSQKKTSKVNLTSYEVLAFVKGSDGKTIAKTRKGVFQQDYSTLTADSSFYYADRNVVESFGHVIINQGDTLHIFADKLHYDGNTKLAELTDNVKMVDKDATLTTNFLTYNTATKIGTYTGGGKLVNKDNTLTSKNGYYFASSRDAYFRYNVVSTTPDALIKTDTLRYNSGSRISYFYGPTNIYGTKDKDVLYTEDGRYEGATEQAFFGKKNLYTQGSKTLKGDSLFYDRIKGYGRAVKNVVFNDNEQKTTVKGGLGEYFKAADRAVITQHPYVIFITEDSTKNSAKPVVKDSLTAKTDNAAKKPTLQKAIDSLIKNSKAKPATAPAVKRITLQSVTDSLMKTVPTKDKPSLPVTPKAVVSTTKTKVDSLGKTRIDSLGKVKTAKVDSMYLGADTIETRAITYKELKEMQAARWLAQHPDTSVKAKPLILYTKATLPKVLPLKLFKFPADTGYIKPGGLLAPKPPAAKPVVKQPAPVVKKLTPADSLAKAKKGNLPAAKKLTKADSLKLNLKPPLSDTSKVRIIFGYHNAKLFKSDLQAKADSMFYSSSDSTIRCFVNPIIWTQGSQLSGDTIALQMKNKKLDNIDLFPSGFIVNIEKKDSLTFNQAGGRRIHGIFKDNKLSLMEITGNAETIYFNRDTVKNIVTEMVRAQSNSLKAAFKNGRLGRGNAYGNTDNKVFPIKTVKEEDRILKGFLWKPKERPQSKEDITAGVKKTAAATNAKAPVSKNTEPAKQSEKATDDKNPPQKEPADKNAAPKPKDSTPQKPAPVDFIISN